jgi:hypothetical protein
VGVTPSAFYPLFARYTAPLMSRSTFKEVVAGERLLRFRIPAAWTEDVEADGGAVYFDETAADTGTLRVKVMTFTAEDEVAGDVAVAARELAALEPTPDQSVEALGNGNALRVHRESSDSTSFQVWMLASMDPPHRMRLAVFSFATLAAHADRAATRRVVEMLDREIRAARFAHQWS